MESSGDEFGDGTDLGFSGARAPEVVGLKRHDLGMAD
jgi:hypothetical protein